MWDAADIKDLRRMTSYSPDIGTRTIAGIVGGRRAFPRLPQVCEHKERAMMDGQIHDIDRAAA